MRHPILRYLRDKFFGGFQGGGVLPQRDRPFPDHAPVHDDTGPAAGRRDTIIRLAASIHANAAGPTEDFDMRRMILEIWDLWRACPSIHGEDDDDWVVGEAAPATPTRSAFAATEAMSRPR